VPKKYPPEFKHDVVTVARRGDLTVPEVAVDFDVSEESVRRWVKQADIDDGIVEGQTSTEQSELVQLRRRMPKLCQWPSCGPRWWPTESPHPSFGFQLVLSRVPPFARACRMR